MKAKFHTDIEFNPRGLHTNSGVRQWENDTLVAIEQTMATGSRVHGAYRVIELPARAATPQPVKVNGRTIRFDTSEQAEAWIERNFSVAVILVQPEDIVAESARRKARAIDPTVIPPLKRDQQIELGGHHFRRDVDKFWTDGAICTGRILLAGHFYEVHRFSIDTIWHFTEEAKDQYYCPE